MENCPNCGNQLSNVDVLCPRCGALVEVIKINTNAPVKSSSTTIRSDNVSDEMILPPQKDYHQNFTVYSDDLPPEPDAPQQAVPAEPETSSISDMQQTLESELDDSLKPEPPPPAPENPIAGKSLREALEELEAASRREELERQDAIRLEKERKLEEQRRQDEILRQLDAGTYVPDTELEPVESQPVNTDSDLGTTLIEDQPLPVDESSYSKEYLAAIRSMELPEIDDLSDFDPDAFMKEYSRKKATRLEDQLADDSPPPVHTGTTAIATPQRTDFIEEPDATGEPEMTPAPSLRDRLRQPVSTKAKARREDAEASGTRRVPVWLSVFLWLAVAAAVFAGFLFLDHFVSSNYGSYNRMFYEITDGKLDLGDKGDDVAFSVTYEQMQTDSGQSAHLFHISSRGGKSVYIPLLNREFPMEDGQVEILIADAVLASALGDMPSQSPYEASGIAFEVGASTVTIDEIALSLDPASYVRLSPRQKSFVTIESFFVCEISVGSGSVVYINDAAYMNGRDFFGTLSLPLMLDQIGESRFDIRITEPGKSIVIDSITVTRQLKPVPLLLENDYQRVYTDAFTISGNTGAGASVTISADSGQYSGDADENGVFSISCTEETLGLHTLLITASRRTFADTSKTVHIERLPEVNAFVDAAKTIEAPDVATDTSALGGQPVRTSGQVKNVFSAGGGRIFTLYTQAGELACIYYGTASLEIDTFYTIYGVYNEQTGRFYAMFVS